MAVGMKKGSWPLSSLSSRAGITLIELLVTISVITILVAILVPMFVVMRSRAQQAACSNNLKQLGLSTQMYTQDWEDTLPYAYGEPFANGLDPLYFQNHRELRLAQRPSQSTYLRYQLTEWDKNLTGKLFECPMDTGSKSFRYIQGPVYEGALTSYLWDPAYAERQLDPSDPYSGFISSGASSESVNGVLTSEIQEPTKARLLQDYGSVWHSRLSSEEKSANGKKKYQVKQGFVNALFADGHVGRITSSANERIASAGGGNSPGNSTPSAMGASSQ